MEIFGMGMWEILLIIVIAIIIWGPANIVGFSKGLGRLVRNLKKMTSDFTNQVSLEVDEEKKKPTDAPKAQPSNEPEHK